MLAAALTAISLLVLPVLGFVSVGGYMMRATGRARFRQTRKEPASIPLNFRMRGYDAAAAIAYWRWLGPEGIAAEVRFLKADMLFPLWYGGLMAASLWWGWSAVGRPFSPCLLMLPVMVTLLGDWTENLLHLREIDRFERKQPVAPGLIRIAAAGTVTKLVCFWLSTALMVVMAAWVLVAGARGAQ